MTLSVDPQTGYLIAASLWALACWTAAFAATGISPLFPAPHKLARIEIGMRAVLYGSLVWLAVALLQVPGTMSRILAAIIVLALAIVETDTRRLLIPDVATVGLVVVALVAGLLGEGPDLTDRFAGGALGLAMFWSVRALFELRTGREALGWGDVKLAGAVGAVVGLWSFPMALLVACAITALFFVAQRGAVTVNGAVAAPFGVGLAIACIVVPIFDAVVRP